MLRRGVRPDAVTDQTSAHDPINGYLPAGWTVEHWDKLRADVIAMRERMVRAFVEAGKQAGFETTEDYNGEKQEGFGLMEQTIWRSRRWSAANAYLKPAMKRGNVELVRCFARKIVIENGRAVGVEIERDGQRIRQIFR